MPLPFYLVRHYLPVGTYLDYCADIYEKLSVVENLALGVTIYVAL